jgi:primosomal protein N' (replication factor Y)
LSAEIVLKVAIPVPLSRLFDYLPPTDGTVPEPGTRVRVTFGRRRLTGLVMATAASSDLPPARLKRVDALLDDTPLLDARSLWLIRFASDYYHHPVGEVAATALPVLLRQGRDLHPVIELLAVTPAGRDSDIEAMAKRAPRQAELLEAVLDAGAEGIAVDVLNEQHPNWRRTAGALREKGLVELRQDKAGEDERPDPGEAQPGPVLNAAQQSAVDAILASSGFGAFVIDGVTGSGKTEVYLHAIEETLRGGRQALVLVPEIGLTPQLVSRFRRRLGIEPVVLHSGLSDVERLAAWRAARAGAAALVLGTRSAVFTPLADPGLIVVDEEHDHSFKQQEGLRYSARDLAVARAKQAGIPILLGSATPTLELQQHCRDGTYTKLALPERAGGAKPPAIRLVDTSRSPLDHGLSNALAGAIETHLAAGGQALLFLNRRGYAPALVCPGCGHLAECRRCDSRMTVHARENRLRCHHCGAHRPLEESCEACGTGVRPLGAGTERLEDAVQERFPGRTVTRIDSDSVRNKGRIAEVLSAEAVAASDILVGTQMLSKGHHFPRLTLVGVVDADQGLFGTDFRADERMAQTIVQVAGRAGRERVRGEVLVQTAFPAHPFWQRLISAGYAGVCEDALAERKATGWPPYSRLALIRATAHDRQDAHAFLDEARRLAASLDDGDVRLLGPVDAVMARKAGRYRAQLLLQSRDRPALHRLLRRLRPALEEDPAGRKARWSIDVDPLELF